MVRPALVPALPVLLVTVVPALEAGKVGSIAWNESISGSVEYNSNITTSEDDPVEDVVVQARFMVDGSWEMTRQLVLSYGFGIGYRRYIGGSGFGIEKAAIQLVPDTQFDFDIRVSDNLTFTVSDKIEFSEDASGIAVRNRETGEVETDLFSFERINNRAAVSGKWSVNQRNQLSASLWREDVYPLVSRFDDYRRIRHGVDGAWTRSLNASLRIGLQGSLFSTRYVTDLNNDSDGNAWGPFFDWGLTDQMTLAGSLSFVQIGFDRADQQPGIADRFDYQNTEFSLRLDHAFNARMSYRLEYQHTSDYGYIANLRLLDFVRATFAWQATRSGQADFTVMHEWGEDSGGIAPEEWEQLHLSLGYSQPIGRNLELSLRTRWSEKQSRAVRRSYEQLTVYIGLVYHFPRN